MYQNENERFGAFITQLRKEKDMTQKELANRLYVSDKAVSKWERGLSMPNVSLLLPLAETLGVTVTELLKGERLAADRQMGIHEVEELVTYSVGMSAEQQKAWENKKGVWKRRYWCCFGAVLGEIAVLLGIGVPVTEMGSSVFLVCGLMLLFGLWACFWMEPQLPAYYDENKISFVQQGAFKISIPGVCFNNRNWPHIVDALRAEILGVAVGYPPVFWLIYKFAGPWMSEGASPAAIAVQMIVVLAACLFIFVPIVWMAKKYE